MVIASATEANGFTYSNNSGEIKFGRVRIDFEPDDETDIDWGAPPVAAPGAFAGRPPGPNPVLVHRGFVEHAKQ